MVFNYLSCARLIFQAWKKMLKNSIHLRNLGERNLEVFDILKFQSLKTRASKFDIWNSDESLYPDIF